MTADRLSGSRRKRVEWPVADQQLAMIATAAAPVLSPDVTHRPRAEAVLQKAGQDLDLAGAPPQCDIAITGALVEGLGTFDDAETGYALCALYWRCRLQSAIFNTFEMLLERGLLGKEVLLERIDATHSNANSNQLASVLAQFAHCQKESMSETESYIGNFNRYFLHHALQWLAIAIVRGWRGDIKELLEHIHHSGHLGDWSNSKPDSLIIVHRDPNCNTQNPSPTRIWGWILPSGLKYYNVPPEAPFKHDSETARGYQFFKLYQQMLQKFSACERTFKQYLNASDKVVALDTDEERAADEAFSF